MEKKKILNLYAGIGGNRKLWGDDYEITAVEYNEDIAAIYKCNFPKDNVIVGDAHQYLLDHHREFDFVWASPPCPSHSDLRRMAVHRGQNKAIYPEMSLYQEIILLNNFAPKHTKFVVENVKPYYEPLIRPTIEMHRHLFWCNFYVQKKEFNDTRRHLDIKASSTVYGFNLERFKVDNKVKILRNMVMPEVGLHFLNRAFEIQDKSKIMQTQLF